MSLSYDDILEVANKIRIEEMRKAMEEKTPVGYLHGVPVMCSTSVPKGEIWVVVSNKKIVLANISEVIVPIE